MYIYIERERERERARERERERETHTHARADQAEDDPCNPNPNPNPNPYSNPNPNPTPTPTPTPTPNPIPNPNPCGSSRTAHNYASPNAARTRRPHTHPRTRTHARKLAHAPHAPANLQVIDGMLTVRKIENVAVGANSKPKLPIVISQCGVRSPMPHTRPRLPTLAHALCGRHHSGARYSLPPPTPRLAPDPGIVERLARREDSS